MHTIVDETVKPEMRQAYEVDKINWLATNLVRDHLACLSLNLFVQKVCGLPLSATLIKIKIRLRKISVAVKVFERSIMICTLSAIKMSWMFFKRKE